MFDIFTKKFWTKNRQYDLPDTNGTVALIRVTEGVTEVFNGTDWVSIIIPTISQVLEAGNNADGRSLTGIETLECANIDASDNIAGNTIEANNGADFDDPVTTIVVVKGIVTAAN